MMILSVEDFASQAADLIPALYEFSQSDRDQAISLIMACVLAIDDEADGKPKHHISELSNGFGCWLEGVEAGLDAWFDRHPDVLSEATQHRIYGAFQMAQSFLSYANGHWANTRHLNVT